MRIALNTGSGTVFLAGNPGVSEREHSSASDIVIAPTIITQPRDGVRRVTSGERDRGNLTTTISFSTTRTFQKPVEAQQFALDYESSNSERTGSLSLTPIGGTGGAARTMADCVVHPPERRVTGCTVFLSYTCKGGKITP